MRQRGEPRLGSMRSASRESFGARLTWLPGAVSERSTGGRTRSECKRYDESSKALACALRRPSLAQRDEAGDAADDLGLVEQRRMTLVGDLDEIEVGAARTHGLEGRARQNVGISAADHHQRHAGERVELRPQSGERPLQIDAVENRRELRVVGKDEPVVLFLPGALGLP